MNGRISLDKVSKGKSSLENIFIWRSFAETIPAVTVEVRLKWMPRQAHSPISIATTFLASLRGHILCFNLHTANI